MFYIKKLMKFNKVELKRGKMTYLRQRKKEQKLTILDGFDYSILYYKISKIETYTIR